MRGRDVVAVLPQPAVAHVVPAPVDVVDRAPCRFGRLPPPPDEMVFEIVSEKTSEDRFATLRTYRQYFRHLNTEKLENPFSLCLCASVFKPEGDAAP